MPAHVDAAQLREWPASADRPRLIDVRSAAEFRAAHIPSDLEPDAAEVLATLSR